MPIAREGWSYILVLLGAGALAAALGVFWLGAALVALGLFTAFFFRDPERSIPRGAGLVTSPADGRVVRIVPAPEEVLGPGVVQMSIFLSIFDVHVNRAPIAGRVAGVRYTKGAFLPAFNDKASLKNEQNRVTLEEGPLRVTFTQIAGLIARRIVFRKRLDEHVDRGERVGLIKFGSRVDVFLPPGIAARVKVGDRVWGGSSVIGEAS